MNQRHTVTLKLTVNCGVAEEDLMHIWSPDLFHRDLGCGADGNTKMCRLRNKLIWWWKAVAEADLSHPSSVLSGTNQLQLRWESFESLPNEVVERRENACIAKILTTHFPHSRRRPTKTSAVALVNPESPTMHPTRDLQSSRNSMPKRPRYPML